MTKQKYVIGIDLGGSKIFSGLFLNNRPKKVLKFWTEADKGRQQVMNNLIMAVEAAIGDLDIKQIKGIGVAAPGPLDYKTGKIIKTPNLPFNDFDLKGFLEKRFGLKVKVDNDAKCAGFAESKARNVKNLVYLTLGTGTGSAVIYEGKIFRGDLFATEFGHMSIYFDGPRCGCGNNGCLEIYTNKAAMVRYAKELGLEQNPYEIQKKAMAGKRRYKKVFKKLGKYLGIGIANIVNGIDIDLVVIGGGIGEVGELVLRPAVKEMKKHLFAREYVRVEKAKLGNFASLIGAAELIN